MGLAVPIPTRFSLAFTTRVSVSKTEDQVKVEEAVEDNAEKAPFTRKVESKVELALTKMPAVVEVGVRALVNSVSQAPGEPAAVQAAPVTDSSPADEAWTHWVEAELRLSRVTAPEANRVPLRRVAPTTPRVVVGVMVPMPTRLVSA